ncbi:hypothetical protein DL766_000924 [Monosporascus sp. MC13-8B]|uniref:Uncharacterized protein n=1 Tax=Monosporascus cannonballus TaxID=155416 RepID=A0ABY0HDP7_9PEZI|nr:hypothetical protein DL762_003310 [Monosporascus cannonballus]RYP38507.1 hypothetical protein DL766_000924 [Monosporascus sp. MC13-8B]
MAIIVAGAPHNNFDMRTLPPRIPSWMLDFGPTSYLILRRLRALKVYAEMLPCITKLADLTWKPKAIVLSGGVSGITAFEPIFNCTNIMGLATVASKLLGRSTPRTSLAERPRLELFRDTPENTFSNRAAE